MVVDGLFDVGNGGHTPLVAHVVPEIDLVVMKVRRLARVVPGNVREIRLVNRPRTELAWWNLPRVIVVSPQPAITAPGLSIAGNQILF